MQTLVLATLLTIVLASSAHGQRLIPQADRHPTPVVDVPQIAGPTSSQAPATGGRLRSPDFRGKVLIVDFWSPGCVPCGPIHEDLTRLAPAWADSGVVVLSLGLAEDSVSARRWLTEHGGAPFPVGLLSHDLLAAMDVASLPHLILVGADGRTAFDGHPHAMASFLPRVLPPLLAEREGRPPPRDPNRLN